jgi:hypothetical protein
MNFTTIRRTIAIALLVLLLAATLCLSLLVDQFDSVDTNDWVHAFCLTHTVLLAACAVYGPGRFIVRLPLVACWGLTVGFALARHNLISSQGQTSLAAGATLVAAGMLPALVVFLLHRWRTGALVVFSDRTPGQVVTLAGHQLSLQMLMILTAAFACAGVAARAAITAPPDPYGVDHDTLIIHLWVGFFPSLSVAPALLVVFRPSWKVLFAVGFFVLITFADPLLLGLVGPIVFHNKTFFQAQAWDGLLEIGLDSFLWHIQPAIALLIYVLLARAAGFRMVVRDQSNDKRPNPSGVPATEAGCVHD